MGKMLICAPNFVDDTYFGPIFGGGSWNTSYPLSNLNAEFFTEETRSVGATTAATTFQIDFKTPRQVEFIGIPDSNISPSGRIRLLGTNTVAWTGVTVNGVNSSGATSLSVATSTSAIDFLEGEIFTIAGDTTTYQITADVSIGSSSTGSLAIKRVDSSATGLATATTGGEVITCRSGDFADPDFDTTSSTYYPTLYPVTQTQLPWGDIRLWTGTYSNEDFVTLNFPRQYVKVLDQTYNIRYLKVEITDTGNTDGYVSIASIYVAPVYRPTYNMDYNLSFGLRSNTTRESSPGGADVFDRERPQRYINFSLSQIPVQEAFATQFDVDQQLDITGNLFFVYDEDDTTLLFRRSFAGRFENLQPIVPQFYNGTKKTYSIIERLA